MFSRPDVVRRAAAEFVPVALKAALVNGPPEGPEGRFLAEIGRSKPAPQGICVVAPTGRVVAWALSFDAEASVDAFLAHALARWRENGDRPAPVERYMRYPGMRLEDVGAEGAPLPAAAAHAAGTWCPATPPKRPGTFEARLVGRAVNPDGTLARETTRQDRYVEDVCDVSADVQEAIARAAAAAGEAPFPLPGALARSLAAVAYLGQLDARPVDSPVPDHRTSTGRLELTARRIPGAPPGRTRLAVTGRTEASASDRSRAGDGAGYAHTVALDWGGVIDLEGERFVDWVLHATGRERLSWTNPQFESMAKAVPDVSRLPAGRPLDQDTAVRYGLTGAPVPASRVSADAPLGGVLPGGPPPSLPQKMQRLQAAIRRWHAEGRDPSPAVRGLERIPSLVQSQRFAEAERLLDDALAKLGDPGAGAGAEAGAEADPRPPLPPDLQDRLRRLEARLAALAAAGKAKDAADYLDALLAALEDG